MIKLTLFFIKQYQRLSRYTPAMCRFKPTCSEYARQAVELHGYRGIFLAFKRLLRCNPFSKGGYDPVPGGGEKS